MPPQPLYHPPQVKRWPPYRYIVPARWGTNTPLRELPLPDAFPIPALPTSIAPIRERTRLSAAALEEIRNFKRIRVNVALQFFKFLDFFVTKDSVISLFGPRGVRIEWDDFITIERTAGLTLVVTAEMVRRGEKPFVNIKLSPQFLDTPLRLYATLAHEFAHVCQLTGFNSKNNDPRNTSGHGRTFHAWAAKVMKVMKAFGFQDKGVVIKDTHGYSIDFATNHLWVCRNCGGFGFFKKKPQGMVGCPKRVTRKCGITGVVLIPSGEFPRFQMCVEAVQSNAQGRKIPTPADNMRVMKEALRRWLAGDNPDQMPRRRRRCGVIIDEAD